MKRADIINQIHLQTGHTKRAISEVLLSLSVVLTGELQANEPVELPHLGRLFPIDKPLGGNRRTRVAEFAAGRELRRKLGAPIRRRPVQAR